MPSDQLIKSIKIASKAFFLWAGALVLYFTLPASAQEQGVQNIKKMKYGFFVHYVWGGTAYPATINPDGSIPTGLDELADRFDAERIANDLVSMRVEYVIFTAWHANMNCLWPSPKMQQWLPGHASRRDVLRDMITAVRAKGIRVLLYTHPSDGHDLTPAEQSGTGWGPTFDYSRWNDFINDIYGDLISRYGKDIEGVYIDEHGGQNGKYVDYPRLRKTLKAGNTNLLMLQNDYGDVYNCDLGDEEVFAFNSTDGNTWPALDIPSTVLLSKNWWASKPKEFFTPKYSPESIFRYTVLKAGVTSVAGGVAWAAGNYPGGGWEAGVLDTMQTVAHYLSPIARSVTNTYASTSYVTGPGATIQSLDWGVATRSIDDRYEYIHVLNPPAGKTLILSPPSDRKIFGSARLLANNHRVTLVQNQSGVTLTLHGDDNWEQLDTVIEMTAVGHSRTSMTSGVDGRHIVLTNSAAFVRTNDFVLDSGDFLIVGTNQTYSGETRIIGSTLELSSSAPAVGMARWFDGADLTLTNGAPVVRWEDLSGNDAAAVRAAGGNHFPTYIADAGTGTGWGAIHFGPGNGPNPALNSEALTFRADANIRTVFSVFKGSSFLLTDYGATHFHRPDDENPASPLWYRAYASAHILEGTTYVNGQIVNGATSQMPTNLHNGFNLVEVLATNSITASGFNKDRYCHAGDQYQAEVLIYNYPLTETQRLQTEAYLNAKWFGVGVMSNLLPTDTTINLFKGGKFALNGVNQTCAALVSTDHSGNEVKLGNATLTVNSAADATFDGVISGAGGLIKLGGNSFTLAGRNQFEGPILIGGGTLRVNQLLGNGKVTVMANSILESQGQIDGPVVIQPGGTLTLGKTLGALIISNTLTLNGTNIMKVNKTAWRRHCDLISGVTTLTYGGVLRVADTGRPLAPGDFLKPFSAKNYLGQFDSVMPPTPGNALVWDLSRLRINGTIGVKRANHE